MAPGRRPPRSDMIRGGLWLLLPAFHEPADDHVENWRQKQPKECHPHHAAEHRCAQRAQHLGASPRRQEQGSTPGMKAKDVMRIGRRRMRQASIAAVTRSLPLAAGLSQTRR